MQSYQMKIAGVSVASDVTHDIRSPYDGALVGRVALGSAEHLEAAVLSAHRAFQGFSRSATHVRAGLLERIAHSIGARAEEFASLITRESGKPIRYARAEVARAQSTFTLAAAESRSFGGEVLPIDQLPAQEGRFCMFKRVPKGVVAAISPFNFPLNLVAHKLAPALAVGACVVLKPAAQAPLTAHVLSDVVDQAGAPAGVFNVVHCPPEVGERLAGDERLKVLSFTGSDSLGFRLKQKASKQHVLLELGGNAPCIVDRGVDLDSLVPKIADATFANAGQVCIKTQRLFVHKEVYEDFVNRFVAATRQLVCGDPMSPETVIGPMIDAHHRQRVLSWVQQAVEEGAELLCGGRERGPILEPTVLIKTAPHQRVVSEEVFGPVVSIEPVDDFEQALSLANQGRFGLQASVFTPSLAHAMLAYEVLEFGAVLVNEVTTFRVDNYPYGGMKDSGLGREGVRYAMQELTEPKVWVLARG